MELVNSSTDVGESIQGGVGRMAKCEICNKGVSSARHISITRSQVSRRAKRMQKANVRKVRAIVDGTPKRVNVCASCLRNGAVEKA